MNYNYINEIANHGANLIKYIGLVDESGQEIEGSVYQRQPVLWSEAEEGIIRLESDLIFQIAAGTTVAGWRGYGQLEGGVNYIGGNLDKEYYDNEGRYKIDAKSTYISHLEYVEED